MGKDESTSATSALNEDAQEVIKDNLDVMYDIIMQIREDEEFAKNIYADCPRLQHMLDERPDLRPIFEDPKLVRINFEEVYRKEGGVLPEDEPKKKSILAMIVASPCFKVLRVFLFFKKIFSCVFGGGLALLKGCVVGLCCDAENLADAMEDPDKPNSPEDKNKEKLYSAADHMEDPEVQEHMAELLENDPEGLQEAIENDPELKELRDSNPLCAELMSDPETMRILTEPENLRALGDAPSLIEADFADPDWTPDQDIETGGGDQSNVASNLDSNVDMDADADGHDDIDNAEEGDVEGMLEEYELGENEGGDDRNTNAGNKKQQQKKTDKSGENKGGGGFFSQVGAGLTDMIASELVGVGFSEVAGGDDDPLAGIEEQESGQLEAAAEQANAAAETSEMLMNDDVAGGLEDGLDEIEDTQDDKSKGKTAAAGAGAAAGVAAGAAAGVAVSRGIGGDDDEGSMDEELDEPKKKGRFAMVARMAAAVKTAGKEYVATALLGDDLGEMVVEKIEESGDDDSDDGKSGEGEDSSNSSDSKQRSSRKGQN